ncbi:Serine/threonine-protein kinase PrkC [Thiorhodovibrio winogradskyi]|uniref:Serine/threonine-protein kinase PrkC n=1 Tax=Thiorhodovibrio winogradskyi TaxID=77007 RepID=A0ABZ0SAF0_9GAMM|nr:serine/threonine-protein kinase [Thiorhodovibrio winogradskyi]
MKIQSAHFLPGANKRLGDAYLLLECLGDGSHGWVWRAERLQDGAIVAVKIPKQLSKEDRSLAEGKELVGLAAHPNVIQIYRMGRIPPEKEWFAIEMEYFPSESLAQKLENRSHHFGNTYERLFNIYEQVLDAVNYLATLSKPISHGDIKPHNILVGQADQVKLTDFGSSALPEDFYVRTRENGGTVLYAAPEYSDCATRKGSFEQLLAGDMYSLGVLLYQLLTGRLPHNTQAQVRTHAPFPKPREINSGICEAMEGVVLGCLRKDPASRFQSVVLLKDAFRRARKAQSEKIGLSSLVSNKSPATDWSTAVIEALEGADYQKAARLAGLEFQRSSDTNALFHQLNALHRAERWFDFAKVYESARDAVGQQSIDGAAIRLLGIKVYMHLRQLERAEAELKRAANYGEEGFEHALCRASIAGMKADFKGAREQLVELNKGNPMNPNVLRRLVQVCEQQRDYDAAAGFLRVALKAIPDDDRFVDKKTKYDILGVW